MLDRLQIHRQILYDLSVHSLESMGGTYERLAYVANLRDPSTGIYSHERLSAVYGEENVSQALADCHEELFERLLESPLALQEEDLLSYLEVLPGGREEHLRECSEKAKAWIPPQAPDYLKKLFCSNLNALCELLQEQKPRVRSSK
jgi:hypothetical protein